MDQHSVFSAMHIRAKLGKTLTSIARGSALAPTTGAGRLYSGSGKGGYGPHS